MNRMTRGLVTMLACAPVVLAEAAAGGAEPDAFVRTVRLPDHGIQPRIATADDGTLHLIYFAGEPRSGNVFYRRSPDGGRTFSEPLRVNSQDGSALAAGTVRGPDVTVGRAGRVHVLWTGSKRAEPPAPFGHPPLLYARMADGGGRFETQRNLMRKGVGLDGGASIGADDEGHVYVVWHAPPGGEGGEAERRVWVAVSSDDGRSFAEERPAIRERRGACGCCGLRAFVDHDGGVYVLYRSAWKVVNRHLFLLASQDTAATFSEQRLHDWTIGQCVASTADFAEGPGGVLAAWETKHQIYFAHVDPATKAVSEPVRSPGRGTNRKFPAVAASPDGLVLLAWTEGTTWGRGGEVAWQVFDAAGEPVPGGGGRAGDLPPFGLVAAAADPDGGFVLVY